jgi:signal transduction histidine kinase
MTGEMNSVSTDGAAEMLMERGLASRWTRLMTRYWGLLFLCLVFLTIWLPSRTTSAGPQVFRWIIAYGVYLGSLGILKRRAGWLYEATLFRLFRVHFNLAMITILALLASPAASSYLWFFFAIPILATSWYFGRPLPVLAIHIEVWAALFVLILAQGWPPTPLVLAARVAQGAILGLLAAFFCFSVRPSPSHRGETTLLEVATTLITVLDRGEVAQLLADAAKAGLPASDGAVVHLLGGEGDQILIPVGSSHLDITTLDQTRMRIGVGIAGYAVQSREAVYVPDVTRDERYLPFALPATPIKSLAVAPMYVGHKNLGTISVHSARRGAFDDRDVRFLTMLATQGAVAIANVDPRNVRQQRARQLSGILESSQAFSLDRPLTSLLEIIAVEVCQHSSYRIAIVSLCDEVSGEIVVRAIEGLPPEHRQSLEGNRIPINMIAPLLQDEFRVRRSYFVRHDCRPQIPDLAQLTFTPDLGDRRPGEWHQGDVLIVPLQTHDDDKVLGYVFVDDPSDRQLPSLDVIESLEILVGLAATAIQNARLYEAARAERERLGEYAHGALNVLLTGAKWTAEHLSDEIRRGDPTAVDVALTRLQAALKHARTRLNYLLQDVDDTTLEEEGLLAGLKSYARVIGGGRITVYGDIWKRLRPEIEGVLYRVGQEAMNNAIKHSGVDQDSNVKIEVGLERAGRQIRLWVKDSGVGFDVEAALAASHEWWGLGHLKGLVDNIGGELKINSVPGKGAEVCATVEL